MATPREIFERDSSKNLRTHAIHRIVDSSSGEMAEITATINYDFDAGVKYASLYVDDTPMAVHAIEHYLDHPENLQSVGEGLQVISGFHQTDERISSDDLLFSNRINVYTAYRIPSDLKRKLVEDAKQRGIQLVLRDETYLSQRIAREHPLAFISYDARDREPFVRELAGTLQQMLCPVWYDEFSLIPGQSIRASIEAGLKSCKKCILVLSPNFISNAGWAKVEFDSIFTREILEQQNLVIPIWHGVRREEVYQYSMHLAERVGIPTDVGILEVAKRVLRGIDYCEWQP